MDVFMEEFCFLFLFIKFIASIFLLYHMLMGKSNARLGDLIQKQIELPES